MTVWQSYCDTIDELDPGSPIKRTNRLSSVDDDLDALPLPEGVLTTNLGLDVVVVVTKVRVCLFLAFYYLLLCSCTYLVLIALKFATDIQL